MNGFIGSKERIAQVKVLDRLSKLIPDRWGGISEFLQYDEYWHRYNGQVSETQDKTSCLKVFDKITGSDKDDKYVCSSIEGLLEEYDIQICPECLHIMLDEAEKQFERSCSLMEFKLSLFEGNRDFVEKLIQVEGYQEFYYLVNSLLSEHIQEVTEEKKRKNPTFE
jgi:hypothetical protein